MARNTPDWTEDEDEWLREFYPVMSNIDLERMKAEDGWPRTAEQINRRARRLGLTKDPSRGYVRRIQRSPVLWSEERVEWLLAYVPGHSSEEVAMEHERVFGIAVTKASIDHMKTKLGIRSGTIGGRFERGSVPVNKGKTWDEYGTPEGHARSRATCFRKGNLPHNTGELLDERLADHNVWQVKVDPRDARHPMNYWVSRSHFNWERANACPWPEGHKALHLNRDMDDDAAENILPVPSDLWPLVMGAVPGQLEWHDRESAEAAVAYARLTSARVDAERRLRIAEGRPRKGDV